MAVYPGELKFHCRSTTTAHTHNDDELHYLRFAHAVPLASARQRPENQKENQAGHSSERAVEGLGGRLALGSQPKGRGARPVRVMSRQAHSPRKKNAKNQTQNCHGVDRPTSAPDLHCELPNEMMARSQCPAMLCWRATQFPCVLCVLALLCNAVSVGRSFWGILVMSPE